AGVGAGFGIAETGPLVGTTIRDNFVHGFTDVLAVAIGAGSSGFEISGNEIFNNFAGVYLSNGAFGGTVSGNVLRDHTGATSTDSGSGLEMEGDNPDNTITQNEIINNRQGIFVWDIFGSDLSGTTVFGNSLASNTTAVNNTNDALLDASGNWWGTNTAAGGAPGAGADVVFTPWPESRDANHYPPPLAGRLHNADAADQSPHTGG